MPNSSYKTVLSFFFTHIHNKCEIFKLFPKHQPANKMATKKKKTNITANSNFSITNTYLKKENRKQGNLQRE